MHPIKSGPGLRTCQAWGPLVYPPGGLRHSSQSPDVHRLTKLTSAQGRSPSCVQRSFHPHHVVVARISSPTKLLYHPGVRPDEILNVKAVIEAYETGSLSAESRKSVWVHGKRRPECESDDLNIHALPAGLSYENSGLIWVEDVSHLSFDT